MSIYNTERRIREDDVIEGRERWIRVENGKEKEEEANEYI
jgi:hypothetical protein